MYTFYELIALLFLHNSMFVYITSIGLTKIKKEKNSEWMQ